MPLFNRKIVIWGYPLYSHTHSFVHYGWFKAFKSIGYEVYWFDDVNFPRDFDYKDSIFLTEGYADSNIPVESSCVYFVHMCRNPSKYLEKGCRLIDVRHNVKKVKEFTYDYSISYEDLEKLDDVTYYERYASDNSLHQKYRKGVGGYEAIYTIWATDALPQEINFHDTKIERQRAVHYVGSNWYANSKELLQLKESCEAAGLDFVVHNPWEKLTTNEEAKKLVQLSYFAPDIRGSGQTSEDTTEEESNHLSIGYIPCRTFKNISYGQLGVTNSRAVKDLFSRNGITLIHSDNISELLSAAEPYLRNHEVIGSQMDYVKNNHTYINRIKCFIGCI